jgi:hypothetical protein
VPALGRRRTALTHRRRATTRTVLCAPVLWLGFDTPGTANSFLGAHTQQQSPICRISHRLQDIFGIFTLAHRSHSSGATSCA